MVVDIAERRLVSVAGVGFALTSASAFAAQGLFAKLAYEAGASTPTVGLGRFAITAFLLWGYAAARSRTVHFRLRLPLANTLALLGLGSAGYFLGSLAYLGAVTTIPVSLAGLLLYLYPAIATVLAVWVGRERLTRALAAGLLLALAGVAVTLGLPALEAAREPDARGIALVLSSAMLYAAYIVGSERALHGVHSVVAMAYIASGASVSYLVLTAVTETFTGAIGQGWLWIAAMAVVSTVVAAGMFLAAIRRLGPSRAATLSTVEPLLTVIFAAIVLGERLEPVQLLGGVIILAGVLIVIRERQPERLDEQPLTQ
jgi:drug/metabolite transporter (DMT)-like permease